MSEKDDGLIEQKRKEFVDAKNERTALNETAREILAELETKIEQVKTEHAQKHAEFLKTFQDAEEYLAITETALRDQLKEWHEASGEKTYDGNLSVRVTTKLEYDEKDATAWAKDNAPFILVADKKQFEKLPNVAELEFVEEKETVTTVIKGL